MTTKFEVRRRLSTADQFHFWIIRTPSLARRGALIGLTIGGVLGGLNLMTSPSNLKAFIIVLTMVVPMTSFLMIFVGLGTTLYCIFRMSEDQKNCTFVIDNDGISVADREGNAYTASWKLVKSVRETNSGFAFFLGGTNIRWFPHPTSEQFDLDALRTFISDKVEKVSLRS